MTDSCRRGLPNQFCVSDRPCLHNRRLPDRRQFLNSALWSAVGLPLSAAAGLPVSLATVAGSFLPQRATAHDSQSPIVATPLADNLYLMTGSGANVVAASGPDGLVLVDGGLEKHSKELLKTALQATRT